MKLTFSIIILLFNLKLFANDIPSKGFLPTIEWQKMQKEFQASRDYHKLLKATQGHLKLIESQKNLTLFNKGRAYLNVGIAHTLLKNRKEASKFLNEAKDYISRSQGKNYQIFLAYIEIMHMNNTPIPKEKSNFFNKAIKIFHDINKADHATTANYFAYILIWDLSKPGTASMTAKKKSLHYYKDVMKKKEQYFNKYFIEYSPKEIYHSKPLITEHTTNQFGKKTISLIR